VRLPRRLERSTGLIPLNEVRDKSQEILEPAVATPVVECPVCGTRADGPPVEGYGQYTLHGCRKCEFTFCHPMRAADGGCYEANAEYEDRWEFQWVANRLDALALRGAVLDIGCGDGRFLSGLADRFTLTGLDLNPSAIERARLTRGLKDVYTLTIEEMRQRTDLAGTYDVVTLFHVLEHVEDPAGLIASIAACLRPGGLLALSVPNPERLALRWCREEWDYPPHHLTRWTPHALRNVLRDHGFQVHEQHGEPLRTLGQLHSVWCDLLWEARRVVGERLGMGRTLRPDTGLEDAAGATRLRTVTLKVIAWIAMVPTLATYPWVRLHAYQGKSLLTIAAK
jgi:SAM-dependent methyltransferase